MSSISQLRFPAVRLCPQLPPITPARFRTQRQLLPASLAPTVFQLPAPLLLFTTRLPPWHCLRSGPPTSAPFRQRLQRLRRSLAATASHTLALLCLCLTPLPLVPCQLLQACLRSLRLMLDPSRSQQQRLLPSLVATVSHTLAPPWLYLTPLLLPQRLCLQTFLRLLLLTLDPLHSQPRPSPTLPEAMALHTLALL